MPKDIQVLECPKCLGSVTLPLHLANSNKLFGESVAIECEYCSVTSMYPMPIHGKKATLIVQPRAVHVGGNVRGSIITGSNNIYR